MTARNIFGIIFFVIAGFFFYMVNLLAFYRPIPAGIKAGLLGGLEVVAAIFLVFGILCRGRAKIRRDAGIVFAAVVVVTLMVVANFVLMMASPETAKMMPPGVLDQFGAHLHGFSILAAYLIAAIALLILSRKRRELKDEESRSVMP